MEMFIVTVIVAILSTTLFLSFSRGIQKAEFDDQLNTIIRIMEKVRGYSLSNVLVNELESAPAEYYLLIIAEDYIQLEVYAEDGSKETLNYYEFEGDYKTDAENPLYVYFFPPYGELCFSNDAQCENEETEKSFIFQSADGLQKKTIRLNIHGGYPEVEE